MALGSLAVGIAAVGRIVVGRVAVGRVVVGRVVVEARPLSSYSAISARVATVSICGKRWHLRKCSLRVRASGGSGWPLSQPAYRVRALY